MAVWALARAVNASARACVVSSCPAFAVEGAQTCQIHAIAERVTPSTVGRVCRRCGRRVLEGAWIQADSITSDKVQHVSCRARSDVEVAEEHL